MNRPCKDCAERYPACHDHCERYQNERKKRAEQIAKYKQMHDGEQQLKEMFSRKYTKKLKKHKDDLWR